MKTDDLLTLLSADTMPVQPLHRTLWRALGIGILVSALVMLSTIGTRPDLAIALYEPRVIAKLVITVTAALSSVLLVFRIGKPGLPLAGTLLAFLVPAGLLIAAVVTELIMLPADRWMPSLIGRNAAFCLFFIPVLSSIPLAGFFWAMREGAPERPAWAGAACGLGSATIAASLYAWHCPDDSPLFVATWYVIAITIVTLAGALAGKRWLRW